MPGPLWLNTHCTPNPYFLKPSQGLNGPAEAHLMSSMREVQTSHIHSRFNHLLQHLHRSGSWADGTDEASVPGCDRRESVSRWHLCSRNMWAMATHSCWVWMKAAPMSLWGFDTASEVLQRGLAGATACVLYFKPKAKQCYQIKTVNFWEVRNALVSQQGCLFSVGTEVFYE